VAYKLPHLAQQIFLTNQATPKKQNKLEKKGKTKAKPTNIYVKFHVVQRPEWEHTIETALNFL